MQNKIIDPPTRDHTAEEETSRWSKKEKRKKRKEEGRRKDLVVALRHFAADPPHSRPTSHRDPRLGLADCGSGFFFFFLPSGLIFFVVVRMIKSPKRFTFPSRF
jgi:hypothetical protein